VYTDRNFKTKAALKHAVASANVLAGPPVTYHQPGPFGGNEPQNGTITLEGPHYPAPHRWYCRAVVKDGCIVKVL